MSRPGTMRRIGPFAAIFLASFLLQVLYLISIRSDATFRAPVVDGAVYLAEAEAFAKVAALPPAPFRYGPLYPLLFGSWYRMTGGNLFATHVLQALFTALTALFTALLARRVFGRTEGILAGILALLYWPFLYFNGEILIEPVFLPILLGFFLLAGSPGGRRAAGAGLLLGLATVARPNTLLLLPVFVGRELFRRRLRRALLLTAGCLAPLLPVAAANLVVGKDAVLVSTSGGINFYIGNNERSTGRDSTFPGMVQWTFEKVHRLAEIETGRRLKPSEVSAHYLDKGLAFARERPGAFVALFGRKVVHFFSAYETPNVEDPNFYRARSPILSFPLLVSFGVVAPLAALTLFRRRRGEDETVLLLGGGAYALSVVLFFVNARYRLPIVPILLVYAAGGLARLARARGRATRALLRPLAVLVAALLLVNWNPLGKVADASQAHFNEGWAEQKNGETEAAEREYGEVKSTSSWFAPALNNRAVILLGRKSWEEAAGLLRQAVAIDSTYYDAWSNLGRAYYALGRYGEAADAFGRASRLWPDDPAFLSNLGLARKGAGDLEGAVRALRSALAADDRFGRARIHLGEVLLALGRPAEALPELERSVRDEPGSAAAWHLLGAARAALGREEEARAAWREVIRLDPASPLAERARSSLGGSP